MGCLETPKVIHASGDFTLDLRSNPREHERGSAFECVCTVWSPVTAQECRAEERTSSNCSHAPTAQGWNVQGAGRDTFRPRTWLEYRLPRSQPAPAPIQSVIEGKHRNTATLSKECLKHTHTHRPAYVYSKQNMKGGVVVLELIVHGKG